MHKKGKRTNAYSFYICALVFITLGAAAATHSLAPGISPLYNYLVAINIAAFVLCGFDKSIAGKGSTRVPEKVLFGSAAIGGSLGLLVGMELFHHKTRKVSFLIMYILIIAFQAIVLYQFAPHLFGTNEPSAHSPSLE